MQHTNGERLVKPCALEMAEIVFEQDAAKALYAIPLSDIAVRDQIANMREDFLDQIISRLKALPERFSIQLDDSTDCSNLAQLICFVRFAKRGEGLKENFLCCVPITKTTKAQNVFHAVKNFFNLYQLGFEKHSYVCTDWTPTMLGNRSGFGALIKRAAPHVKVVHCIIHKQTLISRTLPQPLKAALDAVMK